MTTMVVAAGVCVLVGALTTGAVLMARRHPQARRAAVAMVALSTALSVPLLLGSVAGAAIIAAVPLGTAENFSVLAGSTATNTGPSTLNRDLGLHPGTSVTGFGPDNMTPPATMEIGTDVAAQAQADLTIAYNNAAGRSIDATTGGDLAGLTLQGGAYAASETKGPLLLSGTLTLDGANDPRTVFIFQTDSTLITGVGSSVSLINGALACNVFWQVGSSATLGTDSTFVGTILAETSVTLDDGVTVDGRVLARTGAVTLIDDTFSGPGCTAPTTTLTPSTADGSTSSIVDGSTTTVDGTTTTAEVTTTIAGSTTTVAGSSTTVAGSSTTVAGSSTTIAGSTTTTTGSSGTSTTSAGTPTTDTTAPAGAGAPGSPTSTVDGQSPVTTPTTADRSGSTTPTVTTPQGPTTPVTLPRTGPRVRDDLLVAALAYGLGAAALLAAGQIRARVRR